MDNGSQLYAQAFRGTDVLRSGLLTDDHELRAFQLVSADVNPKIDGDSCVLTVKQTFRHDMRSAASAVFAVPTSRKWSLLKCDIETTKHKVASATGFAKKVLLHQDDRILLKLPFRLYPDDLVTVTYVLFKSLQRLPDGNGDGSVACDTVERRLVGVHEADRESLWEQCFRSEVHEWITTLMMTKVRVDAVARTAVQSIEIAELPDAKNSSQNRTGWLAWGRHFSGDKGAPVLPGDLSLTVKTAAQTELLAAEVVRPANHDLLPTEDQHAIVTSIAATEATTRALGLTDEDFAQPNAEYVFMLDVSGSMYTCVASAAKAIKSAVMALPHGCRYNVVFFGGAKGPYTLFTTECGANNDTNLAKTKALLDNVALAPGGTDILLALKMVYSMPVKRGYGRHIVVITNSPAQNPRECLQLARDHAGTTRVHCVCVDPFYDDAVCKGVARFCNGMTAQSYPSKLAENVLRIVAATCKPCLADVELQFDLEGAEDTAEIGGTDTIRPCYSVVPLIMLGERLELHALAGADLSPRTAVNFACMVGSRSVRLSYHIMALDSSSNMYRELPGDAATDLVPHVGAAFARVRMMTEPLWFVNAANLAFTGRTALAQADVEEIVRLSSTFGFVTPVTSMSNTSATVAVKTNEAEVITEVPQTLPLDVRRTRMAGAQTCMAPQRPLHIAEDGSQRDPDRPAAKYFAPPPELTVPEMIREIVQRDIINAVCGRPDVAEMLNLQQADGAWAFSEHVVQLLGVNYRKFRKAVPAEHGADDDEDGRAAAQTAWSTAACTALLELYRSYHERNPLLPMMLAKAQRYLAVAGRSEWVTAATEYLQQRSIHAVQNEKTAG
eukprot:TRINITY_DN29952_c0_g1_i1.p1 TRINITY_DN29952_c0_g1~~TRINITY_DN29952_c0_g1_i1.p1  ORF type:complete len:840 (+),score=260.12 TRINITY_DN29952_c0_g1_i1:105-2624(+)